MLFELEANNQSANVSRPSVEDTNNSTLAQIAQYVSSTGITYNVTDMEEWLKDKPEIKRSDETNSKTILCMPIFNGQKRIIGVALLINKLMIEVCLLRPYCFVIFFVGIFLSNKYLLNNLEIIKLIEFYCKE